MNALAPPPPLPVLRFIRLQARAKVVGRRLGTRAASCVRQRGSDRPVQEECRGGEGTPARIAVQKREPVCCCFFLLSHERTARFICTLVCCFAFFVLLVSHFAGQAACCNLVYFVMYLVYLLLFLDCCSWFPPPGSRGVFMCTSCLAKVYFL